MSSDETTDPREAAEAAADEAAASAQEAARRLGKYTILKELGRGAQGAVFLAEDVDLRRKVALKILTGAGAQSPQGRDRFRREAELASKIEHPGICGVHEVGEVDGQPFIAMQFVRGRTLADLVKEAKGAEETDEDLAGKSRDTVSIVGSSSKGDLADVLRLVERTARALHVAHEAGLVHRDIKPGNIMVTPDGHPVLLDFGLARDLEAEGQGLTQSGQILGTPAYLAPEQIVASRGAVDRRTDVYALGVTLFECVTLQRPFEAPSWDQLFHQILEGAPVNARAVNPRIPRDLGTVIEVAMERDPARRYPSAEALAQDLRRVRSFEPIQAKAAGPLTRLRKWAHRNPGLAASYTTASLVLVGLLCLLVWRSVERDRRLQGYLQDAADALAAADYARAALSVARAQELDPESPEALELQARVERARAEAQREEERRQALAAAAAARDEAAEKGARYREARERSEELRGALLEERSSVLSQPASEAARADFAQRERRLDELDIRAQQDLQEWREALQRAEKLETPWGGASAATLAALADFHLERWREAEASGDVALAQAMRAATERYDVDGARRGELLGRGTLTVAVTPADAELHLFRWEDLAALGEGEVIPRLVPVPTGGVGRAPAAGAPPPPGAIALAVVDVTPGSPAADAGLAPGDLVTHVNGVPVGEEPLVARVAPGGPLDRAGVAPLARVEALDGVPVDRAFDWTALLAAGAAAQGAPPPHRVGFAGLAEPVECDPRALDVTTPAALVRGPAPAPLQVACWSGGRSVTVELPAGASLGARCERTSCPLVCAPANRVAAGAPLAVDPGSYLVLARAPGREPQRCNLVVERRADARVAVELAPRGTTPPGYVYVPPGPFVEGGDPDAFRPREARRAELPGFFIAREELTNRDWYEFVNDTATLEEIAAAPAGTHRYLPEDDRVMAERDAESGAWTWAVYEATSAESPVLGLAWTDARAYLAWRNARAEEAGEPWRYDLPTEAQWEKAARGVDGRDFPWGERFDPSLTVCLVRRPGYLLDAPGGYEPRDESPFGVLDMGGSREEWLRDYVPESEPPRYLKHGGHWGTAVESVFRCASRAEASADRFASTQGLRLVLRRP